MRFHVRRLAVVASYFLAASTLAQAPADPLASLPAWARDKLVATRGDAKALDAAYKQGEKISNVCGNCHGPAGRSTQTAVPHLAGQNAAYMLVQMVKFNDGKRQGAHFMEGMVKTLSNEDRFAAAVYYSRQPAPSRPALEAALAARGRQVYDATCKACHGERGAGNETIPRIAGQHADYLTATIKAYREGALRRDDRMIPNVRTVADADVKALVAYIGSL